MKKKIYNNHTFYCYVFKWLYQVKPDKLVRFSNTSHLNLKTVLKADIFKSFDVLFIACGLLLFQNQPNVQFSRHGLKSRPFLCRTLSWPSENLTNPVLDVYFTTAWNSWFHKVASKISILDALLGLKLLLILEPLFALRAKSWSNENGPYENQSLLLLCI